MKKLGCDNPTFSLGLCFFFFYVLVSVFVFFFGMLVFFCFFRIEITLFFCDVPFFLIKNSRARFFFQPTDASATVDSFASATHAGPSTTADF